MRLAKLLIWRKTVAGKTALGIALPLIVVAGAFLAYGLVVRRAQAEQEVVESHSHHATMLEEMLRGTIRATGGHDLAGLVAAVREAERYSEVIIIDHLGVIGYAKDPTLVGQQLDQSRPECTLCHHGSEVTAVFEPQTLVIEEGDVRVLRTVVPLRNYPDCHRCHGDELTVAGMAMLEAPMTELDERIDRMVWETVVTALTLLFVAVGAVYTVQHRLVVRPLSDLTARARDVARDVERGGPHSFETVGSDDDDEVGQLAAAFRRMVERLAAAQDALEDKVRVRTAELSELGQELDQLNTQLMHVERLTTMGELAATIAHEVRTPLNALAINLQILKRELKAPTVPPEASSGSAAVPTKKRDTVAILEREIERINAVVEEFMKYARLPQPRLQPADLNALTRSAMQLLELEAKRAGVELSFSSHPEAVSVMVDEDQIRQVLINLVLNALQAVDRGGHIEVAVGLEDEAAQVTVDDDGPGIASEVAESMFKPFVTTKEKGTGLGLAIVSRILREHAGAVTASASPAGGARFEIALPIAEARDQEEST